MMSHNNGCATNVFGEVKLCEGNEGDDHCNNRLRSLFDDALSFFVKEVCVHKEPPPFPLQVFLGDGKPVDLFKLFWIVRKNGGYDGVSRNDLWDFVAEECGFSIRVVAAIKLIYSKYLVEFDQWIWQVKWDSKLVNEDVGVLQRLTLLVKELEGGMFLTPRGNDSVINETEIVNMESIDRRREEISGLIDRKSRDRMELEVDDTQVDACKVNCDVKDDDVKCSVVNFSIKSCAKNVVGKVLGPQNDNRSVVERVTNSHKRKRESSVSFVPMINWLAHAAKSSDDPAVGLIPGSSKWKDYGGEELWKQVLIARKAVMIKRDVDSGLEKSLLKNKVRMHPSMYEDDKILKRQSSERVRSSKRVPLVKSSPCPCCKSRSPCKNGVKNKPSKEHEPIPVEEVASKTQGRESFKKPREKRISVGALFQAEVPAWTGVVVEDDSKWLGTRMWPPQDEQKKIAENTEDSIGKGRESSCLCRLPGSTECVRFHIAEGKMKLSLELGPLFYRWKFNRMGEEVSLSWTIEEEKNFKLMVKSTSSSISKFWRNAFKLFPTKNREKLVSYYFNVHVIRRRCYQNRVTPNEIDSDDDETELGSVGDSFGYEKVHAPSITCSQNMQCLDLD